MHTPVSACASGNEAISLATDQIRLGRADVVLAGGTEAAIHALPMAAFANMMALSKTASGEDGGDPTTVSRPWDIARDGFVLGEGAGVLVLEELEHARARGARIYAEVLGAGITTTPTTSPSPTRRAAAGSRAILRALEDGGISPGDVAHVNAHATSTPQGDIAEGLMIHATLGKYADEVVVTSTKSMTGHLLGGAGRAGVDRHGARHPPPAARRRRSTSTTSTRPSSWTSRPRPASCPRGDIAALNNSFGFGGANVAVAFGSI